ncbi:MAG: hypothetical protein R2751_10200 [Bacteroidales bacterium]
MSQSSGLTQAHLDSRGRLWLASWDDLRVYNVRSDRMEDLPQAVENHPRLAGALIRGMFPYSAGSLLFVTENDGLFLYDFFTETVVHSSESGFPFEVRRWRSHPVFADSRNNVWISSMDREPILRYHYKKRFNNNTYLQSRLGGHSVTSVATDRNNDLWMVSRIEGCCCTGTIAGTSRSFPERVGPGPKRRERG